MAKTHLKRWLFRALKWIVSLAILGYLFVQAEKDGVFDTLAHQHKIWPLLGLAVVLFMCGLVAAMVRCYVLIRTMGIPLSLREALRLGLTAYLFNFISVGFVGEDLFKTVFLARRQQSGRRMDALAVVLMDRTIGFYTLLLTASAGVLLTGTLLDSKVPQIKLMSQGTLVATLIGTLGMALLFVPAMTSERTIEFIGRIPMVGRFAKSLLRAFRTFHNQPLALMLAGVISIGMHAIYVILFFVVACGLQVEHPTFGQHFAVIPVSLVTTMLPLPLGAIGAFEGVLSFLYRAVSDSDEGLIVALGFRAVTIIVLCVSICLYLARSPEIDAALHEAEDLEKAAEDHDDSALEDEFLSAGVDEKPAQSPP